MLKHELEEVIIRDNGKVINAKSGWSARVRSNSTQKFLENAKTNVRAFHIGTKVELYYNFETGDVFIPDYYTELEKEGIKERFIFFISRFERD